MLAPQAMAAVKYDGLYRISYPKQTSAMKTDISWDKDWNPFTTTGLAGIAQVAIDDTLVDSPVLTQGKSSHRVCQGRKHNCLDRYLGVTEQFRN